MDSSRVQRICEARAQEVALLRISKYTHASLAALNASLPLAMALTTFGVSFPVLLFNL
jgi:hypothetical protein